MKNLFKSIFITSFPAISIFTLVESSIHLSQQGLSYKYGGMLLIAFTIVFFFTGLFIKSQARTSRNLTYYTFFIVAGFLISTIVAPLLEGVYALNSYMSLGLLLGWIAYLKWYSVFEKREDTLLKVGEALQVFELEDSNKNNISSSSFLGNPSIYLFYRGNWCPLCMAQIKEIAAQYKELEKRGVTMNFISPQPHKFSASLAKKYDLRLNFLTDPANKTAKQLGIFSENGIPVGFQAFGYDSDTVLPTVIITDASGKIIFLDETDNYRVRPEPETFLEAIDAYNFSLRR